jgi:hypothetical protein
LCPEFPIIYFIKKKYHIYEGIRNNCGYQIISPSLRAWVLLLVPVFLFFVDTRRMLDTNRYAFGFFVTYDVRGMCVLHARTSLKPGGTI